MDTVARGEMVEKDLDRLITKRGEKRRQDEEPAWVVDAWVESVRKHNARRDGERREAWVSYLMAHADRVEAAAAVIAAEKRALARKLMQTNSLEETA